MAPLRAKIIALDTDGLSLEQSQRYGPRKNYVRNVFLPQLGQMGLDPDIVSGITPGELTSTKEEVFFKGQKFRWGRDREGNLAAPYQVCLVLGHMKIWQESVESNCPVLVLEDDAFLEEKDKTVVARILLEYLLLPVEISNHSLLYLQSTCPWRAGKSLKKYPSFSLIKLNRYFFQVSQSWQDISGTAAYLVPPQTCRTLLDHFLKSPIWNIDGMLDDLKRSGVIKILIPKKYKRNFKLHPKFD